MGAEPKKDGSKSRWVWTDAIKIILVFGVLGLVIYSNRQVSSSVPKTTTPTFSSAIIKVASTSTQVPSTATLAPATLTPTPTVSDYRTILLLARATDLILTYIDKVNAGQINPEDASARQPYLSAFPLAIDAYNQTTPSSGMVHAWKNVTMVATAYSLVYPILLQGKMVSSDDLYNLKSSRQWLTNYQYTEESILSASGKGPDYFTAEQQAVEQLLQEYYGDLPVPTQVP